MSIKNKIKKVINFLLKEEHRTTVIVKKADPSCLLKGKRVIITGGNRGLGFEIAKKCIEEKAEVLIVGRNECSLKETSNILNCEYAVCDISNIKSVEKFFENISKYFNGNKVDCLINNAGVYAFNVNNFHDVTEKIWDDLFNVNLKGSYFMTKYFVEYLEKQNVDKGNIVVVSSERAIAADDTPYGITKAGVNSFVKGFAINIIEKGYRINGVAPSIMATDMGLNKKDDNLYFELLRGKRIFLPEEIAEVVIFLLSDISGSISGEIIACNQGNYIKEK